MTELFTNYNFSNNMIKKIFEQHENYNIFNFVVFDTSGSMNTNDGTKILSNGKITKCKRIEEARVSLEYLIDIAKISNNEVELCEKIQTSKLFLSCITADYCRSYKHNFELKFASDIEKPMLILMIDNLDTTKIDEFHIDNISKGDQKSVIGLIIGPCLRINCFMKLDDKIDITIPIPCKKR